MNLLQGNLDWIEALQINDYEFHRRRNPDPFPGTCDWIMDNEKFKIWYQSDHSNLLWISAPRGHGKSVLSSYLSSELGRKVRYTDLVCSFFFACDDEVQTRLETALGALLHQIMISRPQEVLAMTIRNLATAAEFTNEMEQRWKLLTSLTSRPGVGKIYCILDGLNDCDETQLARFLPYLMSFFSHEDRHQDQSNLKFLISSQPTELIKGTMISAPTVDFLQKSEARTSWLDMKHFVQDEVAGDDDKRNDRFHISEALADKILRLASDQSFFWISLLIETLETYRIPSENDIEQLSTVDSLYHYALSHSSDKSFMEKILELVISANRPLSIDEIGVILAINSGVSNEKDLAHIENLRQRILESCGTLINIVDSTVVLSSSCLRNFLTSSTSPSDSGSTTSWSFQEKDNHFKLAESCISYLMLEDFDTMVIPSGLEFPYNIDKITISTYKAEHRFLHYAACNWIAHFLASGEDPRLVEAAMVLCKVHSPRHMMWRMLSLNTTNTFVLASSIPKSDTIAAVSYGLTSVLSRCLSNGEDINVAGSLINNPLHVAALRGHASIVRLLLDQGADPAILNESNGTPLYVAAFHGHTEVVRTLLRYGADPLDACENIPTALHMAAKNGHKEIVQEFLNDGVDPSLPWSLNSFTPLHLAVGHDRQDVVVCLLENGADVNATARGGITALHVAVEKGYSQVMSILLAHGADVNFRDDEGVTALSDKTGRISIIKSLLHAGADPNLADNEGETSLHHLVRHGREQAVELLLDHSTNVDARNGRGGTALHTASLQGNLPILKLLLKYGADSQLKTTDLITPLHLAVIRNHEACAEELLTHKRKADPNAALSDGTTAMHLTAMAGQLAMMFRLYYSGGDLSRRNKENKTPIAVAVARGPQHMADEMIGCLRKNVNSSDILEPMVVESLVHALGTELVGSETQYNQLFQ